MTSNQQPITNNECPTSRPTAFPTRQAAFPTRPTASFILAQGKAAMAAAALGFGRRSPRNLKGCLITCRQPTPTLGSVPNNRHWKSILIEQDRLHGRVSGIPRRLRASRWGNVPGRVPASPRQPDRRAGSARSRGCYGKPAFLRTARSLLLLGVCFLREAPERAIESDRRAGKWGLCSEAS